MASGDTLRPRAAHTRDGFTRALDLGLRTGFGDDWLSLGALKIYTDGGMMARTAALTSRTRVRAGTSAASRTIPNASPPSSSTVTSPAGSSPFTPSATAPPTSPWTPWSGRRSCGPDPTPATASSTPG